MGVHIDIDPVARTIELLTAPVGGVVSFDVARDIYSEAKEDWLVEPELRKMRFPLRNPITAIIRGVQVGPFVFVDNLNGWRFIPYDSDHELTLNGDLIAIDETIPLFVPRATRTISIFGFLSAKTQTALGVAEPPWSTPEKNQIRGVLGLDGTTSPITTKPDLVNWLLDEDVTLHTTDDTVGQKISVAALKAALAAALAAAK